MVIRTPTFGTTMPKNPIHHTWKWEDFHDWQLSAETADVPLLFPHQMVEYGARFPAQKKLWCMCVICVHVCNVMYCKWIGTFWS